jgi:uncharacterized protein
MDPVVVRAWLVYALTLLSVGLLNIDGVLSWYGSKSEGRDVILGGLSAVKRVHLEAGIAAWLDRVECAATVAFEGSYKDKSKCRDRMERLASVSTDGINADDSIRQRHQGDEVRPDAVIWPGTTATVLAQEAHRQPSEPEGIGEVPAGDPGVTVDSRPGGDQPAVAAGFPPGITDRPFAGSEASEEPAAGMQLASVRDAGEPGTAAGSTPARSAVRETWEKVAFHSVLLVGDSLAHGLAMTLGRELKDREGTAFSYLAKVSSGLNNPNVLNWEKTVRMLMEKGPPDLILIMMGVNDANNHIRDGSRLCPVGTPEWAQAYENRVASFLRIVSESQARVYWIGVPVVREQWLQNRVMLANMAARNACGKLANCQYIDTSETLCDENKRYTNYLKESSGSSVRIRAKDGIHFSTAGSDLLSRYILLKLEGRDQGASGVAN